jgi:hypothetical protein
VGLGQGVGQGGHAGADPHYYYYVTTTATSLLLLPHYYCYLTTTATSLLLLPHYYCYLTTTATSVLPYYCGYRSTMQACGALPCAAELLRAKVPL